MRILTTARRSVGASAILATLFVLLESPAAQPATDVSGSVLNLQSAAAAPSSAAPVGWRASYTPIYFDDVETLRPTVGPRFVLGPIGTITSTAGEVISGSRSIKGVHSGSGSYTPYLRTDPAVLPFNQLTSYRVTFTYRILVTPDRGFECLLYSPIAGSMGNFLPSVTINEQAGATGTATLTNMLGPYPDYEARWNVVGNGAIVIDDVRIEALATGQTVATQDGEQLAASISAAFGLVGSAAVTVDSSEVVAGAASVRLRDFGGLETDPVELGLGPNTYYCVEFRYRILDRGIGDTVAMVSFLPPGNDDPSAVISAGNLLKNAEATGTFSTGALVASAPQYLVRILTGAEAALVVDNVTLIRVDTTAMTEPPRSWTDLSSRPYPRLGNYQQGTTEGIIRGAPGEGARFAYTQRQFETRLAFADVIVGESTSAQTMDSDFVRRLRLENPNVVVMPYRISQEHGLYNYASPSATIDLEAEFQAGLANGWFAQDSDGNRISEREPEFADIKIMDISPFCPVIGSQTFNSYLVDWLTRKVLRAGMWDGIFLDNLFASINPHIPNFSDSSLLDYDLNRNGVRDETVPDISNMTRAAAKQVLESFRSATGDFALIVGNAGSHPELALASYVNGYTFECVNGVWNAPYLSSGFSEPDWRRVLDAYAYMQTATRAPHINILEGCGAHQGLTATAADTRDARLVLGTALLGDGFAEYDLFDARSAPYWFDEYSVDPSGTAVENRNYRGYLGQALGPAVELTGPSTTVWAEGFESAFPAALWSSDPAHTLVSRQIGEVISESGSLVMDNTSHAQGWAQMVATDPSHVTLLASKTYVVEFDWRVLSTLDDHLKVDVSNGGTGSYWVPGVVSGDTGRAHFPVTLQAGSGYRIHFVLLGGGRVAIDNVRVTEGGAGPWRRDFERGIALVNPLNRPYTFSAAELAGSVGRTGIRRILGAQDSGTNNGQPVGASLTLGPANAIVLLADARMLVPVPPTITSQPQSLSVAAGQSVRLEVAASGVPSVSYQWYLGRSGTTSAPIPGATSPTYATPPLAIAARYWVRVSNVAGSVDSITAVISLSFTDDPVTAGSTAIRAVHVSELRTRIDALRARFGLPGFVWADPSLVAGATLVRLQHLIDLRSALSAAYVAAGLTPPNYSDPVLLPGSSIMAAHMTEIRAAVQAIE
jgi:putative glycosyl hydrolase-like family 15 (GHL15) protein/Ig-like domain-containing protein